MTTINLKFDIQKPVYFVESLPDFSKIKFPSFDMSDSRIEEYIKNAKNLIKNQIKEGRISGLVFKDEGIVYEVTQCEKDENKNSITKKKYFNEKPSCTDWIKLYDSYEEIYMDMKMFSLGLTNLNKILIEIKKRVFKK